MKERMKYNLFNVQNYIKKIHKREVMYDVDIFIYREIDKIGPFNGKSVLVYTSTEPWYEAMALCFGSTDVILIDPNMMEGAMSIYDSHPMINIETMKEYMVRDNTKFAVAFCINRLQRLGLGRFGDHDLDPNADFKLIRLFKQIIRPGGYLLLAVPIGIDYLIWNSGRIYGRERFPQLVSEWTVVETFGLESDWWDIKNQDNRLSLFLLKNQIPMEPFIF